MEGFCRCIIFYLDRPQHPVRSYSIETFKKFFNHYYYDNSAGFNDIGFRNPAVITPNIDQLARDGVILNRNYVQAICTPSRSSLMTGMYPYKIGRQVYSRNGILLPKLF